MPLDFNKAAASTAALLNDKAQYYGENTPKKIPALLLVLFPDGIPVAAYAFLPFLMRGLDKLARLANNFDGDIEDTIDDLAGIFLLLKAVKDERVP